MLSKAEREWLQDRISPSPGMAKYLRHNIRRKLKVLDEDLKLLIKSPLARDVYEALKPILGDLEPKPLPIEVDKIEEELSTFKVFLKRKRRSHRTVVPYIQTVRRFLHHSDGILSMDTVDSYLALYESKEKQTYKNQLAALRWYVGRFKGAPWIKEFTFPRIKRMKPKIIPLNDDLARFLQAMKEVYAKDPRLRGLRLLLDEGIFRVCKDSGLRIGEVLALEWSQIDFEIRLIAPPEHDTESTKETFATFLTRETSDFLMHLPRRGSYIFIKPEDYNPDRIDTIRRKLNHRWSLVSEASGVKISPHILRSVFSDRCSKAKIPERYIDAFCGRLPQSILGRFYSDYTVDRMREEYLKVEPFLTLRNSLTG